MTDETTTPETPEVPVTPEVTTPEVTPEAPVEPAAEVEAPVEPPASSATYSANIGHAPAQVVGPPQLAQTLAPVEETFLSIDKVITDHSDPLSTRDQFRGASAPAPLPLAGASGQARKPEEIWGTPGLG